MGWLRGRSLYTEHPYYSMIKSMVYNIASLITLMKALKKALARKVSVKQQRSMSTNTMNTVSIVSIRSMEEDKNIRNFHKKASKKLKELKRKAKLNALICFA